MRFAITSPFVPFLRPLAVVPLAVAVWLAIPVPTSAWTCWKCGFGGGPWPSHTCYEIDESFKWGRTECEVIKYSSNGNTRCETSGFYCMIISATMEHDQEAVSNVMAGEALLADGAHFFVVDGDNAVVMRKCDLTVVARIPGHRIPGLEAETVLATDRA